MNGKLTTRAYTGEIETMYVHKSTEVSTGSPKGILEPHLWLAGSKQYYDIAMKLITVIRQRGDDWQTPFDQNQEHSAPRVPLKATH